MNWIDFIIGFTLMNAMPHFVIGIWKGRLLSAFGSSSTANIYYGLLNFVISVSLFIYKYDLQAIWENKLYLGALFILISYFFVAKAAYTYFHESYYKKKQNNSIL